MVIVLRNFIQQILRSGYALTQILLTVYQSFAKARTFRESTIPHKKSSSHHHMESFYSNDIGSSFILTKTPSRVLSCAISEIISIQLFTALRKKRPHSEIFWFVLSRILAYSHLPVFSLNAGKYGPEKLRIQTLFTQ